ncbi:MAG: hypothetical protein QXN63_02565 [Candidatus Bathyarchaeia archaeon]
MGRFSEAVFGRKLPERCLIYAGSYVPERKEWVKNIFDEWQRIRGYWIKYSLAYKNGKEYLLVFNVYGASMTLELIQLLKDGDVKKTFFIGSLGGKDLPIGKLVLPTKITDKTGVVQIENPNKQVIEPEQNSLKKLRESLKNLNVDYVEGEIVSVPCVLHDIKHLRDLVEQSPHVLGVDLETSVFYYFAQKENLESYALLYVSDNKRYDIISGAKNVQEARRKSLITITKIATQVL